MGLTGGLLMYIGLALVSGVDQREDSEFGTSQLPRAVVGQPQKSSTLSTALSTKLS